MTAWSCGEIRLMLWFTLMHLRLPCFLGILVLSLVVKQGSQHSQELGLMGSHLNQNCLCFGGKAKPSVYTEEQLDVLCSLGGMQRSWLHEVFKYGFPGTHEDKMLIEKIGKRMGYCQLGTGMASTPRSFLPPVSFVTKSSAFSSQSYFWVIKEEDKIPEPCEAVSLIIQPSSGRKLLTTSLSSGSGSREHGESGVG